MGNKSLYDYVAWRILHIEIHLFTKGDTPYIVVCIRF